MNVHLQLLSPETLFSPNAYIISFGGRAPPEPAGGTYSAPPGPLAGLRGLLLREGGKEGIAEDRKGEGREKEKREGKGKGKGGRGRGAWRGREGGDLFARRPCDCRGEENISCKALWFLSLFQNLLRRTLCLCSLMLK